jgi:hypothetical protein
MISRVMCRRLSCDGGDDGWAGGGRPGRLWKIVCGIAMFGLCKLHRLRCYGCRGDSKAGRQEYPLNVIGRPRGEESVRYGDTMDGKRDTMERQPGSALPDSRKREQGKEREMRDGKGAGGWGVASGRVTDQPTNQYRARGPYDGQMSVCMRYTFCTFAFLFARKSRPPANFVQIYAHYLALLSSFPNTFTRKRKEKSK